MANIQQSLIILKPDVVQRGIVGECIVRLERRGLKIVALEIRQLERRSSKSTTPSTKTKASSMMSAPI